MNYDMFSNSKNDELDPNFIYPRPYIDPMIYINSYPSNSNQGQNTQPNTMSMEEYMTYMNNQMFGNNNLNNDMDYDDDYYPSVDMNNQNMNSQNMNNNQTMNQNQFQNPNTNMMPNMQCMPGGMMPCPMPCMPNNMMMPGMMFPGMIPNMNMIPNSMMSGMMFPWMMPPYMMMPGMPQIHLEEFDEEEM